MWFDNPFAKVIYWVIILTLVVPFDVSATAQAPQPSPSFKKEELTQLLAPVALYPDALLSQMLIASTYPLEVVQADRWVKSNPGLKGDKLDESLKGMQWDVSVKSLCHFPPVLAMMSDKIDWTQKIGDAFLAQQRDVMDTIQELRNKAYNAGNLTTTNEQVVFVRDSRVIIEPASPGVLYIPVYDPLVVYGPWWYPYYPPYSFYWPYWYPGVVVGPGIVFASAFFVGAAVLAWSGFWWHDHHVYVNPYRAYPFHGGYHAYHPGHDRHDYWRHDPSHRKNVAYRDHSTAQKFGAPASRSVESRQAIRQYSQPARDIQNELSGRRGNATRTDMAKSAYPPVQKARGGASDKAVYRQQSGDQGRYSREHIGRYEQPSGGTGRTGSSAEFRGDQRTYQSSRYSPGNPGRYDAAPRSYQGRTGTVGADRRSAAPGGSGQFSSSMRSGPTGGGGVSGSMRGGSVGGGFARSGRI